MSVDSGSIRTDADAAFFDAVYCAHHRVLYAYLFGQTGDAETAADLLQETFVRVWRHLATARQIPAENRRFWLLATARNLICDLRRRQAVRDLHAGVVAEALQPACRMEDPVQTVLCNETAAEIDAAISKLPLDLRTVLALHLMGDMTSAEIGKILERPAGTVRYQLSQARQRVAKAVRLDDNKRLPSL